MDNQLPQRINDLYWVANYEDDSVLKQFEEDGKENRYADINREQLKRFDMISKSTGKPVYALYINEGQSLIFRRRTLKQVGKPDVVIFLVGYQQTFMTGSGPRNHIVINYLYPDGSIALDGPRNNLELLSFE